jgi:hypothetical protein
MAARGDRVGIRTVDEELAPVDPARRFEGTL